MRDMLEHNNVSSVNVSLDSGHVLMWQPFHVFRLRINLRNIKFESFLAITKGDRRAHCIYKMLQWSPSVVNVEGEAKLCQFC